MPATLTCVTRPSCGARSKRAQGHLDGVTHQPLDESCGYSRGLDLAHEFGALVICDNTFLSPYFQRPLELGADIVSHSTTKYINGHSDVVGGALMVKDAAVAEKISFLQNAMGTCAGPQDCFLVLRGIKTLPIRMEEHHRNSRPSLAGWKNIPRY